MYISYCTLTQFNAFLQHDFCTFFVAASGALNLGVLWSCIGLCRLGRLFSLLGGTDGLVTLRLPQLWLLVPLGENFVKGSTNDGGLSNNGVLAPDTESGLVLQSLLEKRKMQN